MLVTSETNVYLSWSPQVSKGDESGWETEKGWGGI